MSQKFLIKRKKIVKKTLMNVMNNNKNKKLVYKNKLMSYKKRLRN